MRTMRHPNPLVDIRRPRQDEKVGVNPPGFVWKPVEGVDEYVLEVSKSRKFDEADTRRFMVTGRTMFLLSEPFDAGRWYWRFSAGSRRSRAFSFEMLADAAGVNVGTAEELAARMGDHPRLMVKPSGRDALRRLWRDAKPDLLAEVTARADALLAEAHELVEPPFLPPRSEDYYKAHVIWRKAMDDSRRFCKGAQDLAFAYLVSGDARYAEAVARRLGSLSPWDPDGSTSISHNDEPHMSVVNWCPFAFDWAFDVIAPDVRERFAAHLAKRAENTLAHLLHWPYEVNPVSNHAGRMIGFLGHCGLALAGHHERAGAWLKYILELMVSMYPAWGDETGAWAQGFSYGGAYVRWILEFLFSLRTALGIDLYEKPFFRNHARWYETCLPEWSWQTPFGDGGDHGFGFANAALITSHLGLMTGDAHALDYGKRCEARLDKPLGTDPLVSLADGHAEITHRGRVPRAACFDGAGYVAMRRNLKKPDDDIALVLKSSPYGPISHSHGDQNAFVLSAYGEPLLIRTGYYTGYGSAHHQNWIRQTKAHNNVTVGGVGQWVNDTAAVGRIAAFRRGRDFAYACGDASAAYGARMTRFHRHVLFVGYRYFLIFDDMATPVGSTFEWHLHSVEKMLMDESRREVRIARSDATLAVDFVTDCDLEFYRTDEFDVPHRDPERGGLPKEWHLRAATVPVVRDMRLGMLLIPNRMRSPEPFEVHRLYGEGFLRARVDHADGVDEFLIATRDEPLNYNGSAFSAIALWARDGEVKLEMTRPR